jgi:hypothetical protein
MSRPFEHRAEPFEQRVAAALQDQADALTEIVARSLHPCPVRRCTREVPARLLMCAPHWRLVPRQVQRAVWDAYDGGAGLGSGELLRAQAAAIKAVNEALQERNR